MLSDQRISWGDISARWMLDAGCWMLDAGCWMLGYAFIKVRFQPKHFL
jgi:hypothetical protein